MNLSKRNIVVRWAYALRLLTGDPLPMATSACVLFWRVFILTPLTFIMALVASPVIAVVFLLYVLGRGVQRGAIALGRLDKVSDAAEGVFGFFSLIGSYIGAVYHRTCPIVHIQ